MRKLLFYLLLLAPITYAALWLAEHPGSVVIEWMGYELRMMLGLMVGMALFAMVIMMSIVLIIRSLFFAPKRLRDRAKLKRYENAIGALNHTMTALALNDHREAERQINKTKYYLKDNPPVTRLLNVQLAHASGKESDARAEFDAMLEDQTTRPVALRGKIRELMQKGELVHARDYAQEAFKDRPNDHWITMVLLDILFREAEWEAADGVIDRGLRKHGLSRTQAVHYRALVLMARAQHAFDEGEYEQAKVLAERALKAQPRQLAAQLIIVQSLAKHQEVKKLLGAIERYWADTPHPIFADLILQWGMDDNASKNRKRLAKIMQLQPDHFESHLLQARVAIKQRDWETARNALKLALNKAESPRIYEQLAELESAQNGDDKQAAHWLAQALSAPKDFSWTCTHCGAQAAHWQHHCGACHQFDSIEWTKPAAPASVALEANNA